MVTQNCDQYKSEILYHTGDVFVTGTAAKIVPVMSISTNVDKLGEEDFHANFQHGATLPGGPVTEALLRMLREVMAGERKVKTDTGDGWLPNPYASADSQLINLSGGGRVQGGAVGQYMKISGTMQLDSQLMVAK